MTPVNARYGVLLDVDGTLVDTAYLHAVCWWEAFRQHGRHVPMPALGRAIGDCDEFITAATSSADVAASKPNPD